MSAIRQLKAQSDRDLSIGGPERAGQAIRARLIDDYQVFVVPVVAGGGTQALPPARRVELELVDERRFRNGTVFFTTAPGRDALAGRPFEIVKGLVMAGPTRTA